MINKKRGNILNIKEGYIVHGCNAQGVMGSGLALQIKQMYPKVYEEYRKYYEESGLAVGLIVPVYINEKLCIINAITQKYYGRDKNTVYVSYAGIVTCMKRINRLIQLGDLPKVLHMPKIGCGLANGNWIYVSKCIDNEIVNTIEKNLWIL